MSIANSARIVRMHDYLQGKLANHLKSQYCHLPNMPSSSRLESILSLKLQPILGLSFFHMNIMILSPLSTLLSHISSVPVTFWFYIPLCWLFHKKYYSLVLHWILEVNHKIQLPILIKNSWLNSNIKFGCIQFQRHSQHHRYWIYTGYADGWTTGILTFL